MKVPVQQLADDAWDKGRIPNPGAINYLFWKWVGGEHALCDIRKYKGHFFFFRNDGGREVLITVFKDTGPKKKDIVAKKIEKAEDVFQPKGRKYLKAVGLLKK